MNRICAFHVSTALKRLAGRVTGQISFPVREADAAELPSILVNRP
jgi:hypothetical protein